MMKGFEGYYEPDFKQLWQDAVFVFDANVLLDLFRYSDVARKELLDILESLRDRIWIPHQFLLEYHQNKLEVSDDVVSPYDETERKVMDCFTALRELKEQLNALRNRTGKEIKPKLESVEKALDEVKDQITAAKSEHLKSLEDQSLEESIVALFDKKHGAKYEDAKLEEVRKQAKKRFESGIPPCSKKDQKKKSGNAEGDFIGWCQLIEYAKSKKKPIILVANDSDWYLGEKSKTKGPHPLLIQEMYDEAQVASHIYRTSDFIKYARKFLCAQVSESTIEEADLLEADDSPSQVKTDRYLSFYRDYALSFSSRQRILNELESGRQSVVGESFAGEELENPDFMEADLRSADFSGSTVNYGNFIAANLRCVDFSEARLTRANFSGADLSGAHLRHASLRDCVFMDTILPDGQLYSSDRDLEQYTDPHNSGFRRTLMRIRRLRRRLDCD